MYKSIHAFKTSSLNYSDPRIISFNIDQTFYEISSLNDKWKFVRNKNGDVGLAPSNFLEICHPSSKKQSTFMVDREYSKSGDHELSFEQGEKVEVVQGNSDLNIWLVQKMDGKRGLIPSSYLKTSIPVPHIPPRHPTTVMTPSRDLQELRSPSPPPLSTRLPHHGASILSEESPPLAAPRSKPTVELSTQSTSIGRRHTSLDELGSFELINMAHASAGFDVCPQTSEFSEQPYPHPAAVDTDTAAQLLSYVRDHAQISFESACLSVFAVLRFLQDSAVLASLSDQLSLLEAEVGKSLQLIKSPVETEDERAILTLSHFFQERVQDYQERSWEVLSDQHTVGEQVDTLIKIFQEADPRVVRRAVSSDDCQLLSTLSAFYCSERRPPIRLKLVTALKLVSPLHPHYSSRLLTTTLASSLPNDLKFGQHFRLSLETARLAVYLFCSGEQVPVDLYEAWTPDLLKSLLGLMEERFVVDVDEHLPEALMALFLSFNLHIQPHVFPYWSLPEAGTCRTFIDMLMLYLNRDIDPVPVVACPRPHSVLKMALDLTAHSSTRNLFDGSDMRILVDIGIRNVLDLSPSHPQVPIYLKLLLILQKDVAIVMEYRSSELVDICEVFKDISNENPTIHQLIHDLYNLLIF